jgi:integrase
LIRGSVYKRCQCRDGAGRRVGDCDRPHGSWCFTFDAGRRGGAGRRRQVVRSGFVSRDAAEQALDGELSALAAGVWVDDRDLTVGSWLETWLRSLEQAGRSPKTMANYRGHVRDVWDPALGDIRLRDLRRVDIELVLVDLLRPGDRSVLSPVGPGTVGQGNVGRRVERRTVATVECYHRTLRAALSVARRRGLISVNPALGRMDALPSPSAEADRELRVWEPAQIASFLEYLTGVARDPLAVLYEVAAYTGLRRGELCGLRWSDLDADGAGLSITQNLVEVSRDRIPADQRTCLSCGNQHAGLLFKGPKSRAGCRWVPLASPAQGALRRHRKTQDDDRRRKQFRDHDLVFCTRDGDPLRPGMVSARFSRHVTACGLPWIRLHDMRHGACSLLLAGGVPIEVVQMILGHARPTTTRRVYAHVIRGTTAEQVELATDLVTRHRRSG